MRELGLVFLSVVIASVGLAVIFFIPSVFYLKLLAHITRANPQEAGVGLPRNVWLELIPLAGLVYRLHNIASVDDWLERMVKTNEVVQRMRQVHLGWHSSLARIGAFLSLVVFVAAVILGESAPDSFLEDVTVGALLATIVLFVYDVLQWARFWQRLARLSAGRPIEEPSLSISGPPSSRDESLESRCCIALVSTDIHQVEEACRVWARDIRWHEKSTKDGHLLFLYNRAEWLAVSNIQVEVGFQEVGGFTEASFCASSWTSDVQYWEVGDLKRSGSVSDLNRLAESFARGVCSALAQDSLQVIPPELGLARRDMEWLKSISKCRLPLRVGLAALGVVLLIVYGISCFMLGDDGFLPLMFSGLLIFMVAGIHETVQGRALGFARGYRWRSFPHWLWSVWDSLCVAHILGGRSLR